MLEASCEIKQDVKVLVYMDVWMGWISSCMCISVWKKCLLQEVCVAALACVWVCDCDSFHMLPCVIYPPHNNHLCQIYQRDFFSFFLQDSDLSYSFYSNIKVESFVCFPLKNSFINWLLVRVLPSGVPRSFDWCPNKTEIMYCTFCVSSCDLIVGHDTTCKPL